MNKLLCELKDYIISYNLNYDDYSFSEYVLNKIKYKNSLECLLNNTRLYIKLLDKL